MRNITFQTSLIGTSLPNFFPVAGLQAPAKVASKAGQTYQTHVCYCWPVGRTEEKIKREKETDIRTDGHTDE